MLNFSLFKICLRNLKTILFGLVISQLAISSYAQIAVPGGQGADLKKYQRTADGSSSSSGQQSKKFSSMDRPNEDALYGAPNEDQGMELSSQVTYPELGIEQADALVIAGTTDHLVAYDVVATSKSLEDMADEKEFRKGKKISTNDLSEQVKGRSVYRSSTDGSRVIYPNPW
ncbi:hypothetical protein PQQ63_28915 [Paraburkholderia metrosideri]|uniref:Uncharacterized protein n=1 Tax=Paraburkholderia metrosideri TaxID=580937 RepID=A0ABW9E0R0_9BURK